MKRERIESVCGPEKRRLNLIGTFVNTFLNWTRLTKLVAALLLLLLLLNIFTALMPYELYK